MITNKPEVVLPELPVSVARIHSDGYWTTDDRRPDWQWPSRQDVFTADQLRAYDQACIDTLTRPTNGEFVMVPRSVLESIRDSSTDANARGFAAGALSAAPQQSGQEVVAYLTEDEVNGVTRRGLEFADCGTRRPGVSYYPLAHMHQQPAVPGISWEAFCALEDVSFGEHASAKHFIRPYLQGGDVLGWRMVDGVRVFGIVPASGLLPRQDFVRYDDFLSVTSTQPKQLEEAVAEVVANRPSNYSAGHRIKWLTDAVLPVGTKLYREPPPAIDIGKLRQIAAELRDNAHEHRQEDREVGMLADEQEAQFNEELAERIEAALIGGGGERV